MTLSTTGHRVRKITAEQRLVIRARYRAGDQVKDIAADFGITSGAVSYHCTDLERPSKCGTPAGYQRHKALGQPVCEPCRAARVTSESNYARARKDRHRLQQNRT